MQTLRLLAMSCVSVALLCALGCKSSQPTPDPAPVAEPDPEPAEPVVEAEPEPEAFCPEGSEEYNRRAYRWCRVGETLHGNFLVSSDDGGVLLAGVFDQGKMHGEWVAFYSNGAKRWRAQFVQGEEEGLVEGWYDSGMEHYAIPYVAGARDGVARFFHQDGRRAAELAFARGKPLGSWSYWYKNGQKSHEYEAKPDGSTSVHQHWSEGGEKARDVTGQLPKSKVLRVVNTLQDPIVECYTHARVFDKSAGKLLVNFVVGYGGEVSEVRVSPDGFSHPFMGKCAARYVESLTFPDNPYGPQPVFESWELGVQ